MSKLPAASATKVIPSPAQRIVQEWATYEKRDAIIEWSMGLPDGWITEYITLGVIPLLKSKGYAVRYTPDDCVKHFRQWAFAHVWHTRRWRERLYMNYMVPEAGSQEDIDYFRVKVDSSDLEELMDGWTSSELFDDTPAGQSQRLDFEQFLWHILDLEKSKTHRKWRDLAGWEDENEDHTYAQEEGSMAYGGDRRTY